MINGVIPIQKWNGNRPAGIWTLCVKSEKLKILQIKKSQQKRSCQIDFTQFSKTFSIGFSWILPDNLRRKVNECFSASVIILLSNRTLIGFKRPVYAGSQILLLIQTLRRRDLSGCFLVHICAFYSSYSSYFAFLCTSSKIFRAKTEPYNTCIPNSYDLCIA